MNQMQDKTKKRTKVTLDDKSTQKSNTPRNYGPKKGMNDKLYRIYHTFSFMLA